MGKRNKALKPFEIFLPSSANANADLLNIEADVQEEYKWIASVQCRGAAYKKENKSEIFIAMVEKSKIWRLVGTSKDSKSKAKCKVCNVLRITGTEGNIEPRLKSITPILQLLAEINYLR